MTSKTFIKTMFLGVIGAVLTLMAGFFIVQAQQEGGGSGFKISPVRIDLDIERGQSTTAVVEVENVTVSTKEILPIVNDFFSDESESGTPKLYTGDEVSPRSIKTFVQPFDSFTLQPGDKTEISVNVTVPMNTAPGAYYGVVRFIERQDGEFDKSLAFSASVGAIFLINVPGETVELLNLVEIAASSGNGAKLGKLFSSPPQGVSIRLKNEGNTFIAPFGRVIIKNWQGEEVYSYELNDTIPRGNVLPDSIRKFTNEIDNIASFGKYTVEANISYGGGGSIITAKATFWVIPWVTLLLILLAIVAIVYISTRGVKHYNQWVVKRSKGVRRTS